VDGDEEGGNGEWVGSTPSPVSCVNLLHRKEEALESPQKDLRARFCGHYHSVVEDCNKEPIGKYHKHLGIVSIPVTLAHFSDTRAPSPAPAPTTVGHDEADIRWPLPSLPRSRYSLLLFWKRG